LQNFLYIWRMNIDRDNRPVPQFADIEIGRDWEIGVGRVESEIETHRLTLCPPHVVYDYLSKLGSQGQDRVRRFGLDEPALLAMGDPLVRMGLAQWGRDSDVLMKLFEDYPSGSGERLALFYNEAFGRDLSHEIAGGELLDQIYLEATSSEQVAIASNSGIIEDDLERLLIGLATEFDADKDALASFLRGVVANAVITEALEDPSQGGLRKALWNLASALPVEGPWGERLADVYRVILSSRQERYFDFGHGVPDKDTLVAAIEKWASVAKLEKWLGLDDEAEVAMHLTRAGLKRKILDPIDCFRSEHVPVRCAAFRETTLTDDTEKQLSDTGLIIEAREALMNRSNWTTRTGRILLHRAAHACWEANRGDVNLEFDRFWTTWDGFEEIHRRDNPDWFLDELPEDEPDEEPDRLKEEIDRLWDMLNHQDGTFQQFQRDMKKSFGLIALLVALVLLILIF